MTKKTAKKDAKKIVVLHRDLFSIEYDNGEFVRYDSKKDYDDAIEENQ